MLSSGLATVAPSDSSILLVKDDESGLDASAARAVCEPALLCVQARRGILK